MLVERLEATFMVDCFISTIRFKILILYNRNICIQELLLNFVLLLIMIIDLKNF
jgi:hypothetical protein